MFDPLARHGSQLPGCLAECLAYHTGVTSMRGMQRIGQPPPGGCGRSCARPACPGVASATLTFDYTARETRLGLLESEPRPEAYDLCDLHAQRTRPPNGWRLIDERPSSPGSTEPGPLPGLLPGLVADRGAVALLEQALSRQVRPLAGQARPLVRPAVPLDPPVAAGGPARAW